MVKNNWDSFGGSDITSRLRVCSRSMDAWGKNFAKKFRSQIDACKTKLRHTRVDPSEEAVHEIQRIRSRLTKLLIQEEQYWKQRAKTFWLVEGDSNTRFYGYLQKTQQ